MGNIYPSIRLFVWPLDGDAGGNGDDGALAELAKLIPPTANKLVDGKTVEVMTSELVKGDKVLVRPGEKDPG